MAAFGAALRLCCCGLLARSAAGTTLTSGELHNHSERHLDGDLHQAVLVDPSGEIHPRRAMMRSEAQGAHGLLDVDGEESRTESHEAHAIVENVSNAAFLQSDCEGESETNPGEGERTYSSVWGNEPAGNGHARSTLDSHQAWSALHNRANEWMQIDLGEVKNIGGVVTQGRHNYAQWVTSYTVMISEDAGSFDDFDGVLMGNRDQHSKVFNRITSVKRAQYVRFMAKGWFGHISMRAAVLTCKETTTTTTTTTSTSTTTTTTSTTTTKKKKLVKAGAPSRQAGGAGALLAAFLAWWVAEQV